MQFWPGLANHSFALTHLRNNFNPELGQVHTGLELQVYSWPNANQARSNSPHFEHRMLHFTFRVRILHVASRTPQVAMSQIAFRMNGTPKRNPDGAIHARRDANGAQTGHERSTNGG